MPGNGRSQLSCPTNGKRRFRKERIGCLIGWFKIDPTLPYGSFCLRKIPGIIRIFRFQSFREILSLNKFQTIDSRFPRSIDYLYLIAYPVLDTLQNRNRFHYRSPTIITKLAFTGINPHNSY